MLEKIATLELSGMRLTVMKKRRRGKKENKNM
jgi:hypothetical protein